MRQIFVVMQEQRLHCSDVRACSDSGSSMSPLAAYQRPKGGIPRTMAACWKYTSERVLVVDRRRRRSCYSGEFRHPSTGMRCALRFHTAYTSSAAAFICRFLIVYLKRAHLIYQRGACAWTCWRSSSLQSYSLPAPRTPHLIFTRLAQL